MIGRGTAVPNALPNKVRCIPSARVENSTLRSQHHKSGTNEVSCEGDREIKFSLFPFFYFLISGVFSIFRLVYSLGSMVLSLVFLIPASVSGIVKQKCKSSVIVPGCLPFSVSLSFLLLCIAVGSLSGEKQRHVKGSKWNFDSNLIGSPGAPIVSCSLAEQLNVFSETVSEGNLTFPYCPKLDLRFVLVGKGEKPVAGKRKNKNGGWVHVYGCGDIMWSHICSNLACRKLHAGVHRCLRKVCPDCYDSWLTERSNAIRDRLMCSNALSANFGKRLAHVIISPHVEMLPNTLDELNMMIRDVYKYAKSKGIAGGALIYHPWRVTDIGKKLARDAHMKTWEWLRSQENFKSYLEYSGHFHMLAYIGFLKPPVEGERFIYKSITDNKNSIVDFRGSEGQLLAAARYLLSHTADIEGENFDSIRWFGTCARPKFETNVDKYEGAEIEKERQKKVCKICGSELMPVWDWVHIYYFDLCQGALGECEYDDEIFNFMNGDPPPEDAINYLVEGEL